MKLRGKRTVMYKMSLAGRATLFLLSFGVLLASVGIAESLKARGIYRVWTLLGTALRSVVDDKKSVSMTGDVSPGGSSMGMGPNSPSASATVAKYRPSEYDGSDTFEDDGWNGYMDGFDWELEKARRLLEGPSFAPLRMTLWQPDVVDGLTGDTIKTRPGTPPGFFDQAKILLNNAMQMAGISESIDGAPMVQGVNTFKGSFIQLLSRVVDGDLQELAGGPLFLLLWDYYKKYGPVYKLAFGPKSFIVISDPTMVKHILKDNPTNYDKGILAEILAPVMGKGLIPADPETWKVRRKAIVPGFHKAWLNAMVRPPLPFFVERVFCPWMHTSHPFPLPFITRRWSFS